MSIIVPCYNAEKYIDRCVNSLVNQTIGIENLELIFVNDASTDNTFSVLQKWEQKYSESIMIINCEENGKQGKARNIGLSYATAEYIGFADNDDIIELCMFEKMYERAKEFSCDLVVCRSKKHTIKQLAEIEMGRAAQKNVFIEITNDKERLSFLEMNINKAIWNKIYRNEIIKGNNIVFPEGYIYDDLCFSELIKHYVNKIFVLEEYLYHHIIREEAASYSAKDWITKLGWFDVQVIKINELRNRGIYSKFEERYQGEFLIDYITFIYNFINTYSYIPPNILNMMKDKIITIFPDYKQIPVIRETLKGKGNEFVKLVCQGLEINAEEEYVVKLVEACRKR